MERRDFLRGLAGAAGLPLLPGGAHALTPAANTTAPTAFQPDDWQAAFDSHRAEHPWQMGFEGLQADVAPMPLKLHGRLPPDLRGAFLRNGPARHTLGGQRYHHWFDGDGMVQKYEIGAGGIVHRGRFVRTEKFAADSAAGHPVRAAFGTSLPGMEPITSPDSINVANTSLVSHGGEFLALWEGGSATRVDPASLDTLGVKTLNADYAGMPFSAHPKIGPDGVLWNFGVSSRQGVLSIYRISPDGRDVQATSMKVPNIAMVHDFAVTERHLVFLLPSLVFDVARSDAGASFLDSHVWRPELGMRVMVLPKDRLDAPRWFELPAGFVFHVGNAWEDAKGETIHLDYVRSDDASYATHGLRNVMRGEHDVPPPTWLTVVMLDLRSGRARQDALAGRVEFPRVDPRRVSRRHREVFVAQRVGTGDQPMFDAVARLDVASGRIDRYRYGPDVMAEEHVFVPRTGRGAREGEGWLLGTALDIRRRAMLFSVFDARQLAAGPVAQGVLPRVMPLGLHAVYLPA
ncbi:MAG: carotenoid oxygenase [Variovorax paradoxus]|uniref:Carotenoid oxygenase n=1 Tax=Variovorax paradoxus TaxID=34073 RepID=A0A2W5RY66_VARPD|nr:MAG: carotenoid oxygenase [Variovorax paradoxus]